jgi:hypothetical protein
LAGGRCGFGCEYLRGIIFCRDEPVLDSRAC